VGFGPDERLGVLIIGLEISRGPCEREVEMHVGVRLELAVVFGLVGVEVVEDYEPGIPGLCRRLLG